MGYAVVFSNDHPGGDGLAMLQPWASTSAAIDLGVGVLALDRHQPDGIAGHVDELGLPVSRLVLGLGAGWTSTPLQVARTGVAALRAALPGARVIVAAMGPKMCQLAGEVGDGALLNWMTPERARWAVDLVHTGAAEAGRAPGSVTTYGYVRVAVGPDATERLASEASMYQQMPHYARNFEAAGTDPTKIGIAVAGGGELPDQLARYDAFDVTVVRVLSERDPEAVLEVARAAKT